MIASQSTSILLIEDNPGDATLIQERLLDISEVEFDIQWATRLDQGIEWLERTRFDVILLDLTLPDSAGLESFTRIHEAAPRIPVIILSGHEDEKFALRAVRAGAEDYLVKGKIPGEALARAITYTVERNTRRTRTAAQAAQKPKKRGRVIAFYGAKGGVGTTTIALNVAAALAKEKKTVVAELRGYFGTMSKQLGELSVHSNLSALLKVQPDTIRDFDLSGSLVKYSTDFAVMFSPQKVAESGTVTGEHAGAIVDGLAAMTDYVVLDLPPEPNEGNREAARRCDFIGLVLDREHASLAAAWAALSHIRSWGVDAMISLVLVHRSPLICPLELETVTGQLGLDVIELIPPAADTCIMAAKAGVPLVTAYEDALVGSSLLELAQKLTADPIRVKKIA